MRLIDADALKEKIKNSDLTNHMKMALLSCVSSVPAIAPPPNDPLTLDELREMNGEPVWISPAKETGKILARWMLASGYWPDKDRYLFEPSSGLTQGYDGGNYGKTWLAYRRKPEPNKGA